MTNDFKERIANAAVAECAPIHGKLVNDLYDALEARSAELHSNDEQWRLQCKKRDEEIDELKHDVAEQQAGDARCRAAERAEIVAKLKSEETRNGVAIQLFPYLSGDPEDDEQNPWIQKVAKAAITKILEVI